ncbi:MAG: Peptidase M29 aminopeptidase II, partial [Microgenomates group bacterium GW2011_GWD1_47_13]
MQVSSQDSELARVLLAHSLKIKPKEKVLISVAELGLPLGKAVYQETLKLGAYPLLDVNVNGMEYPYYQLANQWQLSYVPSKVVKAKIEWADAFVRIVAEDNLRELAQIDSQKIADRSKLVRPLWDPVIDSDRWVLTWYPTSAMAQEAGVSTDWLREFYFGACLVDYAQMGRKLKSLEKLMDRGKLVHIVGQMTDLRVQIGGRLAQACAGGRNI